MIDFEPSVFFDQDDFACSCTRVRAGVADVAFAGILGAVDEALFERNVQAGTYELRYPFAAVQLATGDTVRTVATDGAGVPQHAQTWRVLRTPERQNDGAEGLVLLTPGT